MSEEKVLKKLDIPDFRHLSKDKVISMMSMLDRMDPEVAKKAIEQFPDFAVTCKEIVSEYSTVVQKELEQNKEVTSVNMEANMITINTLNEMLKKDEYSFEEKQYIIEQLKYFTSNVDKIDTRNKNFLYAMGGMFAIVVIGGVVAMASSLGGNTDVDVDSLMHKS